MRLALAALFLSIFFNDAGAQSCVPTNNNNAVFNFACGINCGPVNLQVPHLKSTSSYALGAIPYNPYPFITPTGNELSSLYADDIYSEIIYLPFQFCFYDSVFSKVVVGSNGLMTFDTANANCDNAWTIGPPIFFAGGTICAVGSTYYPKASIMGAFSDLDPRSFASPPDRKIEWRLEGAAPCRRLIVSYYHVGVFGNNCGVNTPNTFQMVIYESTGLIDVFFEQKTCFSSTNNGRGIFGVQNWERNKAVAGVGRNSTQWNAQNEGWRFVPNGGASRFVKSELFTMGNVLVATADTSSSVEGLLDINFPNVCPSGLSEQFVVKTTYSACDPSGTPLESFDTITVNITNSLSAGFAYNNINCSSASAGSITISIAPGVGVPPYQYSLNGGALQSNNVFSGLAAGNYVAFATDVNGCNVSENITIGITGNIGVSAAATATSCAGVSNGTIVVTPTGGIAPFQYTLNGGAPQPGNSFTGLAAGNYTVTVTDAFGCTGTQSVAVTNGTNFTATINTTATSCAGASNGSMSIIPNGGTAPFQYSLNGSPWQASNTFTGLAANNYTVSVKDANNCITTSLVTINAGGALTANLGQTNVTCNGGNNGSVTVTVLSGSAPYQYSLDGVNFQAGNSFSGLIAGTYTVYFRDANNCTGTSSVTLTQPSVLTSALTVQPVACFGQSNGMITVSASGGVSPYTYSIDGVNYQGSNAFNVSAGLFTVFVKDSNGCIFSQIANVVQPNALVLSSNASNASCNGGNDGIITVFAAGGTGPYLYSIDGTNFQAANTFNVLPGNYVITARDANNCTVTENLAVGLTNNMTLSGANDTVICEGKSVQLNTVSNATVFSWSPGTGLDNPSLQNPLASPTTTTQYVVTATLGNCTGTDTIRIIVNPAPVANAGADGDICYGQDYQLQASGGVQYIWTPSTFLSSTSISNPLATPDQTTTYSLHVIDANGCQSLTQAQVTVNVTPPIIVMTYPRDTIVYAGDQFQLLAVSAGTDYSWSPPLGLSDPLVANPVLTVSSDMSFTVTASTSAGCKGDGIVNVKVYKGPDIYVPTGFTPNGDGRNDVFRPIPVGIKAIKHFRVYNRWGQLVFSTKLLHDGWDGRVSGVLQPSGTFVWMVQGLTKDDKLITKRGTVTLIR